MNVGSVEVGALLWSPLSKLLYVLALFTVLVGLLQRVGSSGDRTFVPGRITGIVGLMGGGKSMFAAWLMLRHLRANVPMVGGDLVASKVAANFEVEVPGVDARRVLRVRSWEDIARCPRGTLVIVDEAHVWCGATPGMTLGKRETWVLSMLRKLGLELVWISQHEAKVSATLRRETGVFITCLKTRGRYHRARAYAAEDFRKPGARYGWSGRYRVTPKLVGIYDSFALLPPPEGDAASAPVFAMIDQAGERERVAVPLRRGLRGPRLAKSAAVPAPEPSAS